jgi:hypothetical protein
VNGYEPWDRRAATLRRYGAASTDAGDHGSGEVSALEEGVGGRNLLKVSPQLACPPSPYPLSRGPDAGICLKR